jgi:hypothetical protein
MCMGLWLLDGFWIGWIWFIDTLYTALGTTRNYSATADLRTLQFTRPTLVFSIFISRIMATDL